LFWVPLEKSPLQESASQNGIREKREEKGEKTKCPTCGNDLLLRTSLTAFKIQLRYHCHAVPVRNKPK